MTDGATALDRNAIFERSNLFDALSKVLDRPLAPPSSLLLGQLSPAPGSTVAYVSTPITTGPQYLKWLSEHKHASVERRELARRAMIERNISAVKPLVRAVAREHPNAAIIDPTELEDVPGWEQSDYHRFWSEVIARFADFVVFADGWTTSVGCTVEFAVATISGIPMYDSSLRRLTVSSGVRLLEEAVPHIRHAGAPADMQHEVANSMIAAVL